MEKFPALPAALFHLLFRMHRMPAEAGAVFFQPEFLPARFATQYIIGVAGLFTD
jgi:hypothetical protein